MSQWRIGDVTITKVVELEVTGGSRFLLPQATPEAIKPIAWLRPHFADENGRLRMSIHTFLIPYQSACDPFSFACSFKIGFKIPGYV